MALGEACALLFEAATAWERGLTGVLEGGDSNFNTSLNLSSFDFGVNSSTNMSHFGSIIASNGISHGTTHGTTRGVYSASGAEEPHRADSPTAGFMAPSLSVQQFFENLVTAFSSDRCVWILLVYFVVYRTHTALILHNYSDDNNNKLQQQ